MFKKIARQIGRFISFCTKTHQLATTKEIKERLEKQFTLSKQIEAMQNPAPIEARRLPSRSSAGFNPPSYTEYTEPEEYTMTPEEAAKVLPTQTQVVYKQLDVLINQYSALSKGDRVEIAEKFYKQIEDWSKQDVEDRKVQAVKKNVRRVTRAKLVVEGQNLVVKTD